MGACSTRKHKKSNKGRKKLMKGKNFKRSDDQIVDEIMSNSSLFIMNSIEKEGLSLDEYEYCIVCSKYFSSEENLIIHQRTKAHKRRIKILQIKPYSHEESHKAGGFGSYSPDFFNPVHLDALKAHTSDPGITVGKRKTKSKKNRQDDLSVVDSIKNMII